MDCVSQIEQAIGRCLTGEEQELLHLLSAQGMAKINFDLCRGISLESTLADLLEVFRLAQQRKATLASELPENAAVMVGRMSRPPTADEMVLLSEVPMPTLLFQVNEQLQKGVELEDALEDLAQTHLQKRVFHDAQRMANAQQGRVSISRLAPTRRAVAGDASSPSVAQLCSGRIRVGSSAVVTWFEDSPRQSHSLSCSSLGSLGASESAYVPSPRSVLRRTTSHFGSDGSLASTPASRGMRVSFSGTVVAPAEVAVEVPPSPHSAPAKSLDGSTSVPSSSTVPPAARPRSPAKPAPSLWGKIRRMVARRL